MLTRLSRLALLIAFCGTTMPVFAQSEAKPAASRAPVVHEKTDLTKQPTLYVVGYAHLDTEWRWTYVQTIKQFVPDTMRNNFPLFEKYPHYVFNFSGSRRYQFMDEYYPEDYAKVKEYVKQGRWFPCGSSVDENDANVPSAESQIRHVLYGNRFFRKEFGVASDEFMLPDCFGFPYALPSILAHCGVKGFSTQKLTWGSAAGIPFKVGLWEGPDGRTVVSALDPGAYVGDVKENLAKSESWKARIDANGKKSGVFVDYHYYGVGDQGGAPREPSVQMVEESVKTDGPIRVISSHADWMFQQITPELQKNLPRYKGELLLTEHSAGSITSQAYMKRWNRQNEQLADAAERAGVAAMLLNGATYPAQRLEHAWSLVLGSQMHDILPGTSVPKAYEYAWNDEVLAGNEFADMLTSGVGAVASTLDTRTTGEPVVLFNPLSCERSDVVEFSVSWSGKGEKPTSVSVTGPDGAAVPAQLIEVKNGAARVLAKAKLPSVGFGVFDVKLSENEAAAGDAVKVSERTLENGRYKVTINDAGDIASIFDKSVNKELLSAPARLALQYEKPNDWPAWNMDWADRKLPPRSFVDGPATITITERGPVRATIRIEREHAGSTFVQDVSLSTGGETVEFNNRIDWTTRERSLKASFPLAASNPNATYDLQTGVIERDNNNPKRYENPAHMWMDLTDKSGAFGASILNNSKYGSDKPDDRTLRLTLIYTPGVRSAWVDQATQDIGRHDIAYSFAGHAGDWRKAGTPWLAARKNQPIRAFNVSKHDGAAGKSLSLVTCDSPQVMVTAIKKAEDSDEVIVRLRELTGQPVKDARVQFNKAVASAREVDGQERPIGEVKTANGALYADVHGYGLKAYAVKLSETAAAAAATVQAAVDLPYDTDVVSSNAKRTDGAMEKDLAYPAEQFPKGELVVNGTKFIVGDTADGKKNAVACNGQRWSLNPGKFNRVEVLAAASGPEDVTAQFMVETTPVDLTIQSWRGYVGQWDNRRWSVPSGEEEHPKGSQMVGLDPGFIKPAPIAWYCSHHHQPKDDAHYHYCYVYRYTLELPPNARSIFLPKNPNIKIFAATAVGGDDAARVTAAAPLRDMLADRAEMAVRITPEGAKNDATLVRLEPSLYFQEGSIRYTTDGSDPKADSPVYGSPLMIYAPTTIKAAITDKAGKIGAVTTTKIDHTDTTAPRVTGALAVYASDAVRVQFSEPVDAASAGKAANYEVLPEIEVRAARVAPDGRSVTLMLGKVPATDLKYSLKVSNVADASPARNTLKEDAIGFAARGPVYRLDALSKEHEGATIRGIKNLPSGGSAPWTINMFVRTDKQPANRTVIAGFGRCDDKVGATGRYISKFGSGIHFWSRNADVQGNTAMDLGKWQMLTATSDGGTIRLYKNGKMIAEQAVSLADDEPIITLLPLDPWEQKRRFAGEVREFTVWDSALTADSLGTLYESFKAE